MQIPVPGNSRLTNSAAAAIILAISIVALQVLQGFLVPLVFAVLLTFLLNPIYTALTKRKVPSIIAMLMLVLLLCFAGYLVYVFFSISVDSFIEKSPYYGKRLYLLAGKILAPFHYTVDNLLNQLHFGKKDNIVSRANTILSTGIIQSLLSSFSEVATDILIILLFFIFMLPGKKMFEQRLRDSFTINGDKIVESFRRIDSQVQIYLAVKTITALAAGSITFLILQFGGVDFAAFFAILTVLFHFIPNIGAFIATSFPILFTLLQFGFSPGFGVISILLLSNQFILGNFIEPKFLGKHLDLSPVVVLISLFFWGWLWGIPGMFLSVPLTAIIKIACSNVPSLKPLVTLMGSSKEGNE
ncbi:MAG: AI-2E family transporter [Ignavibacteria bacterium]|nr:AI-2E family transporter [Ignavibacteria bacterium]